MSILPVGFGSSASTGYTIDNSLRFDGSNDYLSKTYGAAGNQKKWTASFWVKRSTLSTDQVLFEGGTSVNDRTFIRLNSDNTLSVESYQGGGATRLNRKTSALYRDTTAWYHIVWANDTDASSGSRSRVYVNGSEVSWSGTNTDWTVSYSGEINSTNPQNIGRAILSSQYFSGYIADFYFVDGSQLSPTDFGETNADGVWVPIAYTGTYGTNGFHLDFADGTSTTTLGYDAAGSNDWTLNGMTRAAGASECWVTDTPTNNFATLNPLDKTAAIESYTSNGNLTATAGASTHQTKATIYQSTGKWVAQANIDVVGTACLIGVWASNGNAAAGTGTYYAYRQNGNKEINGTGSAYGAAFTTGDIIRVEWNADSSSLEFFKNGTSQGVITGVTGTLTFGSYHNSTGQASWNFGQYTWLNSETPTSGFLALSTANLPTVSITNPAEHFDIETYTGTAATKTFTGLLFQPSMVWMKSRGRALDHAIYDAVRGVEKRLESNNTDAEVTGDTTGLTAFTSDGWTIGALDQINGTTATNSFVGWAWKANGAGVSNTDGSITSTVSANTTAGFSIVTYTGTGANATVGHGLGVAPKMVIVKSRSRPAESWGVWHTALTSADYYLLLNSTAAQTNAWDLWNGAPSSTVLNLGTDSTSNYNTGTCVAYCFAEIPGFSKFGSYTGNGSTDGPYVHCGFRPRWVMIKISSGGTGEWNLHDAARNTYNAVSGVLWADLSASETTGTPFVDFLANGFKLRDTFSNRNANGSTYIFAAFAEYPFGGSNVAPSPAR